jgi:hypothetical protein
MTDSWKVICGDSKMMLGKNLTNYAKSRMTKASMPLSGEDTFTKESTRLYLLKGMEWAILTLSFEKGGSRE